MQASSTGDTSERSRLLQWRASFAVRLYQATSSEHFIPLLSALLDVRISSLRILQMRFWKDNDLPRFTRILRIASQHVLPKQVIESVLRGWTRSDEASSASGASVVDQFVARIEAHLKTQGLGQAIRKNLGEAETMMAASELHAMRQLQHLPTTSATQSHDASGVMLVTPLTHFLLFPPAAAAGSTSSSYPEPTNMQTPPDVPSPVVNKPIPARTRRSLVEQQAPADVLSEQEEEEEQEESDAMQIDTSGEKATTTEDSIAPAFPPRAEVKAKSAVSGKRRRTDPSTAPAVEPSSTTSGDDDDAEAEQPPAKKSRKRPSSSTAAAVTSAPTPPAAATAAGSTSSTSPEVRLDAPVHALPTNRAPTRAVEPIAFARPLGDALPFERTVADHLRQFGIAVVEPSFREHTAWLAELNIDLLQHASFQRAYKMTLGCFNAGSSRVAIRPKSPSLPNGLYASPSLTAEQVSAFLEAQWSHLADAGNENGGPSPPAAAVDCIYLKDLSAQRDLRRSSRDALSSAFFPKWDQLLEADQERREASSAAAASLCEEKEGAAGETPRPKPSRGDDVVMQDAEEPSANEPVDSEKASSSRGVLYPALFMDAYADHPASLLRLTDDRCDGVHNAYAYLKHGFQFFNLHIEQWLLPFVHHQMSGESTWILIPHSERQRLHDVVQEMAQVRRTCLSSSRRAGRRRDCEQEEAPDDEPSSLVLVSIFLYSKSLLPPLSLLRKHDIHFHTVRLRAGQVLVAHGGFAHFGFNTGAGETHAFACNIMSEEWLVSGGPQFVVHFFEWMLDLSDLEPAQLDAGLLAHGLDAGDLQNALNTCPPAYSCSLLRALCTDLRLYLAAQQEGTAYVGPSPRGRYSLEVARVRGVLSTLETALALLHHPDLRTFLARVYVSAKDEQSHLCECAASVTSLPEASGLSETAVRGFYASMERHHVLVVASGAGDSKPPTSSERRSCRVRAPAAASIEPERPISTAFGSATATPMSRVWEFLRSDAIQPRSLRLSQQSRFVDIGSGIGQVVLDVQLRFALASAIGIEVVWDRCEAGEKTLECLRHARDAPPTRFDASPYDVDSLRPVLDDRLDRIRFVHGRIEDHTQELLADATHVFMFDAAFHPFTHTTLLPLLCVGPSRIVITCLPPERMVHRWPEDDARGVPTLDETRRTFHFLKQLPLTMAGSNSTRTIYVYVTRAVRCSGC